LTRPSLKFKNLKYLVSQMLSLILNALSYLLVILITKISVDQEAILVSGGSNKGPNEVKCKEVNRFVRIANHLAWITSTIKNNR